MILLVVVTCDKQPMALEALISVPEEIQETHTLKFQPHLRQVLTFGDLPTH
jgi:hypothetical protein